MEGILVILTRSIPLLVSAKGRDLRICAKNLEVRESGLAWEKRWFPSTMYPSLKTNPCPGVGTKAAVFGSGSCVSVFSISSAAAKMASEAKLLHSKTGMCCGYMIGKSEKAIEGKGGV